jgi:hypothetical protein
MSKLCHLVSYMLMCLATTPSTDTSTSCTELTALLNVNVVSDPSPLNLSTAVVASNVVTGVLPIKGH